MQSLPYPTTVSEDDRKWLLLGAIAAGVFMITGNLAIYPMMRENTTVGPLFSALWTGVLFGQAGLGIIWLVLAPPVAWIRAAGAGAAYLTLAGACLIGLVVKESLGFGFALSSVIPQVSVVLGIPLLLISAAFPLGLFRLFLGWHIQHEGTPPKSNPRQYSLGNLILLTTLIAGILGLGNQAALLTETEPLRYWVWMFVGSLTFMTVGAALLLPACFLLTRHGLWGGIGLGCVTVLLYAGGVYLMIQLFGTYGAVPSRMEIAKALGFVACPFLGFFITLCLPLVAAHKSGYSLVTAPTASNASNP